MKERPIRKPMPEREMDSPHPAEPVSTKEPPISASTDTDYVAASPAGAKEGPGYLIVKTSPPFARLFLDGKEAGTTPTRTAITLAGGAHELILEREGCKPMHASFRVAPQETTSMRYVLEKSGMDSP
jgi:hypothetical protein